MVIKANKGFYDKLSRKELQNLCKLYGLPANRSHLELEKSLIAYIEEGINSSICNIQKPSHSKGRGVNHRKAQIKSTNQKLLSFSDEDVMDLMLTKRRDMKDVRCPAENAFASFTESLDKKVRFSPFEFYVQSEEGINLYVDLNSSPSDWNEKLNNEVHIFGNVNNDKSRSLHEDLGRLKELDKEVRNSFWKSGEEIRDGHLDTQPSRSSNGDKIEHSKLDPPEMGEMSLVPITMQSCSISVDVSEKSKEDQSTKPCFLHSNSQNHIISVADSCAKAGYAVICDSDAIDANDVRKSIYCTPANSLSDGPSSRVSLGRTIANLSRCQSLTLQHDSIFLNPAVVDPGCSVSSSLEIQVSEAASCNKDASDVNCENGGQMGGFDLKHDAGSRKSGLANSIVLNPGVYEDCVPVPTEDGERSNILNERESSECSQFTKASEKPSLNSDKLASKEGLRKKRKHVEGENQSGYAIANIKILRSMKRSTRKDFPRRSMRLLSKVF